MPHARRIRDLTDERLRRAQGEIAVGAYAARMRRRRLAMGCAGAGLLLAAILLYLGLRPAGPRDGPRDYAVRLRCNACEKTTETRIAMNAVPPLCCPACGEPQAWPEWRCRECEHVFIRPGAVEGARCPKCGSPAVGSAAAP